MAKLRKGNACFPLRRFKLFFQQQLLSLFAVRCLRHYFILLSHVYSCVPWWNTAVYCSMTTLRFLPGSISCCASGRESTKTHEATVKAWKRRMGAGSVFALMRHNPGIWICQCYWRLASQNCFNQIYNTRLLSIQVLCFSKIDTFAQKPQVLLSEMPNSWS